MKPEFKKSRYANGKKATNLSLDERLVDIAKEIFPRTAHGSLSNFVESALSAYLRRNAVRIRRAGVAIPETVFIR